MSGDLTGLCLYILKLNLCVLSRVAIYKKSAKFAVDNFAKMIKTITNFVQTVKFNPEGTCGPIWPEVVPLFRSCSWPHCGAKKIVKM